MPTPQDLIRVAAEEASPSLARVGHWMAAHLIQTLSHSAEDIAALTGTSVAAVNRFSCAAGFEGFTHLKAALAEDLQSAVEPVRKLGSPRARPRAASIDVQALHRAGESPAIQRAAGKLLKARQVWLLGFGASTHLAGYAAHVLMPYLASVRAVAGEGGTEEAARRLSRCERGDVLIAISLPRYSKDTLRLADFARERGAHVIAITDAATAPLAALAHTLLLAPSEHPVMPSSVLGIVAVIESLASAVISLNPEAVRIARDLSELVLAHLAAPVAEPARRTAAQSRRKAGVHTASPERP